MDSEKLMISCLCFRAIEEIAEEEIGILQGTSINKGKIKTKLTEVRGMLLRELGLDAKNYSGIDMKRLRELREREIRLKKLFEGKDWDTEDIESLRLTIEEKNKLLETDNEVAQSYYIMYGLIEKIAKKIPTLDVDGIIELDTVIDSYLNGEIDFQK